VNSQGDADDRSESDTHVTFRSRSNVIAVAILPLPREGIIHVTNYEQRAVCGEKTVCQEIAITAGTTLSW
jgi:hypothetical protein